MLSNTIYIIYEPGTTVPQTQHKRLIRFLLMPHHLGATPTIPEKSPNILKQIRNTNNRHVLCVWKDCEQQRQTYWDTNIKIVRVFPSDSNGATLSFYMTWWIKKKMFLYGMLLWDVFSFGHHDCGERRWTSTNSITKYRLKRIIFDESS